MLSGKCQQCAVGMTIDAQGLCSNGSNNSTPTPQQQQNTQQTTPTPVVPTTQPTINNNARPSASGIRNCDVAQGGLCVSCASGFFPDGNGGCKRVIIGCLKMDAAQENCVQCISAYTLDGKGGCLFPTAETQTQSTTQTTTTPTNRNAATAVTVTVQSTPTAPAPAPATNPFPLDPNCQTPNNNSCAICRSGFILNLANFSCW
jgi:hypothetical protein